MKIYKEEEREKSWALELINEENDIVLAAVDSDTGEYIGSIIRFFADGDITPSVNLYKAFIDKGYDPYEHGNKFNDEGSISIL